MSVHNRRRHYRARRSARRMRETAGQLRTNPEFLKREPGKKGHERRGDALARLRGAPTQAPPPVKPKVFSNSYVAPVGTITSAPTTRLPRAPKVSRSQKEREARRATRRAKKSSP